MNPRERRLLELQRKDMNTMNEVPVFRLIAGGLTALLLSVALLIGGCSGAKTYQRYQKRADANNKVKVTHILIRNAQQQAQIVRAQNARVRALAQQRVIEAEGIRKAQDLISKTLTPLYVQHEAIKALRESKSGDRVYIPVGEQGVPLVANVNGDRVGRAGPEGK